jgi:hypothetical protein
MEYAWRRADSGRDVQLCAVGAACTSGPSAARDSQADRRGVRAAASSWNTIINRQSWAARGQVAPYAILSQFPLSSDLYLDPDQVVSDEYKEEWSPHPVEVTPIELISGSKTIQGWAAGTPADSEDTLHFAELTGVRPMIEIYPLEKAAEAYARMMSGKARIPRRPHDVRRSGNTSEHGSTNSKRGVNDSSFLIVPLNPMLADFLPLALAISVFAQFQEKEGPMEHPISYRTIQIDGISIFYREAGPKDAPTILLLHGLPSSSRMFQPLLTRLADDYHLVAPDYPLLRECLRLAPQVALQW